MATIIQSLRVMACMLRDGKFRNERANNMYETNMKTNFEDKNRGKTRFRQTQLLTRVEHKVRSSEQGVLSFHIIPKRKCMYKGNTCLNELFVNFGTPPHDLGL